jgi:predicted phage terminase large subunit-like protein
MMAGTILTAAEMAVQARAEKARRERARRHLVDFAEYCSPWYRAMRHHKVVAEALEQVEAYVASEGEEGIGRLMIFEPPRHGKTEEVSRQFPAWFLGRNPDKRVILTSYGADLAQEDSRMVRNLVSSERFGLLFGQTSAVDAPVEISDDSAAKAAWDLAAPHRGGVVAAGVGGSITGKGAHLLIADDLWKNRDEAESETYRQRVVRWWKSSAYTRLERGGAVVVTHTRWHPQDLAGELLEMMASEIDADEWHVVFLPALAPELTEYAQSIAQQREWMLRGVYMPLAEVGDLLGRQPGEALWPQKYTTQALERIRANIGDYDFASLYQQMPMASAGDFFKESDFEIVDEVPHGLSWYGYVDVALGKRESADWNTALMGALDEETGIVYYRHMLAVHELTDFIAQVTEYMLAPENAGALYAIESTAFQSLVVRELMKNPRLARVAITEYYPTDNKTTRARAVQTRGRLGKIRLLRGAWNKSFIAQAMAFPTGKHDDMVDAASGILEIIADMPPMQAHDELVVDDTAVKISEY